MTIARSAGEALRNHVTLELECFDRLYLNAYVPLLQTGGGAACFFREIRGNPVPSSALMAPMTRRFTDSLERFARDQGVDVVSFRKGERKDDVTQGYLRSRPDDGEGVLYVGKAQEKARVLRTRKRIDPATGRASPELVDSTAMVNAWYVYLVDDDFGPCFIKFCSYFPYNAKLCINGHEYLKRQLEKRSIPFEALDNGIMSCADPAAMQDIAGEIDAGLIDALFRKWLARLPHPFTKEDRAKGIRYDLSILQAECALTRVFDRPAVGRVLFEEIIRENLDIGRADHVQLIFGRRITRRTASRFRTRVITDGVLPSLHVDYKRSRIKQYFKEGRALRTETVINNTYDFGVKRRLCNLDDLKEVGFKANRRLLDVQRISHDCPVGVETFDALHRPAVVDNRRVSALRFGDPRLQAVLTALLMHVFLPTGFSNRQLREAVAQLWQTDGYGTGQATYDLRRLRLRGLIERLPKSHRYRLTEDGHRIALAYCRIHRRTLTPALAAVFDENMPPKLGRVIRKVDEEIARLWTSQPLAA